MKKVTFKNIVGILFLISLMACNKDNSIPCISVTKTNVLVNEEITFTNCTKAGEKYLWQFGDGITSEEASPKHKFVTQGTYKVVLSIVSPGNSSKYSSHFFLIINVMNSSHNFFDLDNGKIFRQFYKTKNGVKDPTTFDTSSNARVYVSGFQENPNKIIIYLPLFADQPSGDRITEQIEIVNNEISLPKVDSINSNTFGGPVTFGGMTGKYENGKVMLDWTVNNQKFKPNDFKNWVYHVEFFK